MLALTRDVALGYARVVYRDLVTRALEVSGEQRGYIEDLAVAWGARLSELDPYGWPVPVEDEAWQVLQRLSAAVADPEVTPDALLDWVDAYPDAIVDLLGSPADLLTDDVDDSIDEPAAGNRQPALAYAA
jgi:hypothetical protein